MSEEQPNKLGRDIVDEQALERSIVVSPNEWEEQNERIAIAFLSVVGEISFGDDVLK
jgi:hypothetical protein